MSISDIFNAATPGLAGLSTDIYTACIGIVAVMVIVFGVRMFKGFLTKEGPDFRDESKEDEDGGSGGKFGIRGGE
jgi:hypothetical protein